MPLRRFAEGVDFDRFLRHQAHAAAEIGTEAELEVEQDFDDPPVKPGQRLAGTVHDSLDRGRILVGWNQGAAKPVQQAPFERQDACQFARNRPVRLAKHQVGARGGAGRFERRIARALAVTDDRDPLAL